MRTARAVAAQYPDLSLADVYAAVSYYLRNRAAVDAYMADRREAGERLRTEIEAQIDPDGIRDRLLARRAGRA